MVGMFETVVFKMRLGGHVFILYTYPSEGVLKILYNFVKHLIIELYTLMIIRRNLISFCQLRDLKTVFIAQKHPVCFYRFSVDAHIVNTVFFHVGFREGLFRKGI